MGGYPPEIVLTLPGFSDPALAIAATRAGALGVLDLEFERELAATAAALSALTRHARAPYGVKLDADAEPFARTVLDLLPESCRVAILAGTNPTAIESLASALRERSVTVFLEARSIEDARLAARIGAQGIVAKGHEAGGRVGEETSFILLQRLLGDAHAQGLPVFVQGGIGLHTAAACRVAGAAGIVLDWQLALTREAAHLPDALRGRIQSMDGSETACLGGAFASSTRLYARPGVRACESLQALDARLSIEDPPGASRVFREAVIASARAGSPDERAWLLGQDAAFAARLASRFGTVGGVLAGIRRAIDAHLEAARAVRPLDEGSPLAESHHTRYPILQGPMTRVSDVAPFALAVAEGGGLPFLALALLREPEVRKLLRETQALLGERSWGVGILGFVPLELRKEQLEVIREVKPPFALIAGGRPDQAKALEHEGIATYLHVPSPGLLEMFVADGARRFVFEGRECGGHVGPRSSFVLWETMVETLLRSVPPADFASLHAVFAGGIHDARSAAMVAAIAAPLAEKGAKIGALLGTAYLFTREAVATGAIQKGFQEEALRCGRTVLLETGPGHATRCVDTAFAREFLAEKKRLLGEGRSAEELREALEMLNLGRLRIASKGIAHGTDGPGTARPRYVSVPDGEQRAHGMYMIGQLAELRHAVGTIASLHREVSVEGTERLLAGPFARIEVAETPVPRPSDVAIIGMACLLPKAGDLRTFWENVLRKVDAITEVPAKRWDWRHYFDADRRAPDKIYSRWGGFLEDVPFDPMRYGIPPSTLASIEPMHLLALEVTRAALSDAGCFDREFPRERTSVIFGAGGGVADLGAQYALRAHLPLVHPDAPAEVFERLPVWTEDSFAGILPNVAAGRVANRFDLGGVNFTVDAACASSLAAVHLAVRELEAEASDMVIVGGLDTMQNPFTYLCFAKTQALSPHGRCRPFDAGADGIVISEGLVALVLKRLSDAERDGDRIYAVIKAVAGSSDGRDRGLTAPRPEGQVLALERAYEKAGFSPATVGLFEAHGTGTVAGDQAEAQSLGTVLRRHGAAPASCAVGSVKSMIGHTKCTAGVAGLMKVALALHDRILPPTLHVETPNPRSGFGEGPLYVNSETRPWIRPKDHPRRAAVSAFGFGGTNFHAVIEEYGGDYLGREERTIRAFPAELFLWTGPDRDAILAGIEPALRALGGPEPPRIADLACAVARAYTGAVEAGGERITLAVVADSAQDLAAKLGSAAGRLRAGTPGRFEDPRGIYFTDAPLARAGRVAFLFPGQGSQRPDMLRDLAVLFPEVREAFERADRVLEEKLDAPLSRAVFPRPCFTKEEERAAMEAITDTRVAQPALGAAGAAITTLLDRFGVRPAMTAGHSYGEYLALYAAGRIDERTLLEVSEARGRAIVEAAGEVPRGARADASRDLGTMAAVDAPAREVEEAIRGIEGVVVANLNAPRQTIISGPRASVQKALSELEERGLLARPLRVACAFHSDLVAPARDRLIGTLSRIRLQAGRCPVYSNTLAAPYPDDPEAALALLADHLVRPVRFHEEIEAMYAAGARVFVEAGPGTILTGLVRQILEGRDFAAVAVDTPRRDGVIQLLHALAQMAAQGVAIDPARLYEGRDVKPIDVAAAGAGKPTPPRTLLWLVNGSRAWPAAEPATGAWTSAPRSDSRPAVTAARPDGPPPAPSAPAPEVSMRREPEEASRMPATRPAAPDVRAIQSGTVNPLARVPQGAGDRAAVMLHHQQLMARFLETQRRVMLAYLQGSAAGAHERPWTVVSPAALEPVLLEPRPAPAAIHAAHPPAPAKTAAAPPAPRSAEPGPGASAGNGRCAPTLEEVTSRLVAIASERTGYPPEMLDLDLDLEADLGIDSIKRVEILGTFQTWDAVEGWKADEEFMERVRLLKTFRAIAGLIAGILGGTSPESPSPPGFAPGPVPAGNGSAPSARGNGHDRSAGDLVSEAGESSAARGGATPAGAEDGRVAPAPAFAIRAVEAPLEREGSVPLPAGAIVITDDESGIAEALRAEFARLGARALVIPAGPSPEDALDRARASAGAIGGLIHLAPLAAVPAFEEMDLTGWRERVSREVKSLHRLIRAAGADLRSAAAGGGAIVLAATLDAPAHPHRGAIPGLIRCLAFEWPAVRCRAVDLEADEPGAQAGRILAELGASGPDVCSAWRNGRRVVLRPVAAAAAPAGEPIDSGAVLLLTGGARGITAEIARALATRAKPTLVLAGRSPLPAAEEPPDLAGAQGVPALRAALLERAKARGERVSPRVIEAEVARILAGREIRENLRALAETGARVMYRSADVRNPAALGALIEEMYATFGRIDGVIHGAGVIEDKLLEEKAPESFDRVFDTKADSAFLLARMLRPESLRFLVLMSSVAGAFGNRGQGDYGAANETLNHLAIYLDRRWPGRVVAINWGPWDARGMVSEEVRRQFAERGVQVISPAAGCDALVREIVRDEGGEPVLVIGDGPWRAVAEAAVPAGVGGGTIVTPLLRRERLASGRGGILECVRVLDPAFDRYLHHHQLGGKPVLPAAAAIALMAEAAQQAWPERVVAEARDVRVLRGITLDGGPLPVRIAVRAQTHASAEISDGLQATVEITEVERPERAYYRATMVLGERLPDAPACTIDFPAPLRPYPLPIEEVYRQWLFHGPVFQCIRRVHGVAEEGILGDLLPSRPDRVVPAPPGARWIFDPVLVDGCLQLSLLWVRAIHGMTGLPSRMRAVRRYAFDPGVELRTAYLVREGSGNAVGRADIVCLAPDGRVALAIDGFEFTCTAALNRLVGWDESKLPPSERGRA